MRILPLFRLLMLEQLGASLSIAALVLAGFGRGNTKDMTVLVSSKLLLDKGIAAVIILLR